MTAVIQYNAGNTGSVLHALNRLGQEAMLTADPDIIRGADKVILPGVGEAGSAMARLNATGMTALIPTLTQPVLGICLGLQLMCRYSEEGATTCLGIIDTAVKRFPAGQIVPHMGWNNLEQCQGGLFEHFSQTKQDVYFVHSYYAELCPATTSICDYIIPFSASLQYNNFHATQFHPEKSGDTGEQILKNFLAL